VDSSVNYQLPYVLTLIASRGLTGGRIDWLELNGTVREMFLERKKREKAIAASGMEHRPAGVGRRGLSSAALMPFVAGVVIGLTISTLAVVRLPNSTATGSITNIYISLGN
jgi:hypothetical protein